MIAPPPLGCRREVPSLINRVGWLSSHGSNKKGVNVIGPQMIFKKITKVAAAHLVRPVESPSGTISETSKVGQNVKISSARPEPSRSTWSSVSCTLVLNSANNQKLLKD